MSEEVQYVLCMNKKTGAGPFSVKKESFAKEIDLVLYEPKMDVVEISSPDVVNNDVVGDTDDYLSGLEAKVMAGRPKKK